MRLKYALIAAAILAAASVPAFAGQRSATLTVSGAVIANCVVQSPIAFNFGTYGPQNFKGKALVGKTKVLSIACTRGAPGVRIALSNGTHFSKKDRHLIGPGSKKVAYQIYTTAKLKEIWSETNTVAYVPTSNQSTAITMYGKVPGGQKPAPGQYSDTLTATVNF